MKEIILLLTILLVSTSVFSQDLTLEQKKLQTEIYQFLREEGYMPEIIPKNNISFKKEGEKYYVEIDTRDTHPLYIALTLSYVYSSDYSKEKIAAGLKDSNLKKGVKVICFADSYSYRAEMYLVNAEQFKYTFYKLMEQIGYLKKEVQNACTGTNTVSQTKATLETFFPIYGVTLGKTTVKEAKKMGFKVEKYEKKDYNFHAGSLTFWDFNHDDIFEWVSLYNSSNAIPVEWSKYGFDFSLSYSVWKALINSLGFTIDTIEEPKTVTKKDDYKFLDAKIVAFSSDGKLKLTLDFSYGNKNGEGYSIDSKNSLFSLRFERD